MKRAEYLFPSRFLLKIPAMRLAAYVIVSCFLSATLHAAELPPTTLQSGDQVAMPQSDQTHTVEPGDTLWDLTAKYLQNPWYWPKVWSYNPQLTNPHFIYPGQVVRFFPSNDQLPARIEASTTRDMPGEEGVAASQDGNDGDDNSEAEAAIQSKLKHGKSEDAVSVSGNRPLVYNASRGMVVQNIQLVTKKELKDSGEITNAFDDKRLLSNYDTAFVTWAKNAETPQVGQPLILFKTMEEVEHPVTGKDYGYLTFITGTAEVVEVPENLKKDLVTIRILKTFEPVERGQFVAPQKGPLLAELQETPNNKKLDGYVLAGGVYSKEIYGQFHYVFVDRGTNDGVVNGNHFTVVRDRDVVTDDKIPRQTIGRLVVIDAKETASLTLVTQAIRDIAPGDQVLMREK